MPPPITAVWPGKPEPHGAIWDGEGVNFALFSENAEAVDLCIFDPTGRRELQRIPIRENTDQVWHCYLPEARPGLLYGYRVHGRYAPHEGHRFNAHKLLLDPYARCIVGQVKWSDAMFAYPLGGKREDLAIDRRDNARGMPKCKVIDSAFTWADDRRPDVPWHDMVIYETHVRGFTMQHPAVPAPLRGTYAGFATAPVIEYLKRLGVTTVEFMPVHAFVDDRRLVEQGLRNYWGYNTIGFFAPEPRYSASGKVNEFKTMVKTLHSAGLEVIVDVVYNHTAEGNHLGPTLCFRGLDNAAYYRLAEDRRFYVDYTGCGNTLNMQHPRVLQMLMDSLRYWVSEMHVDGFRFDLASSLARELHAVNKLAAFFDILRQDPVLNQVKLIAEPWDIGEGGYQVGNFPPGWAEWNDKYRDTMRAYWKGDGGLIGEFARRLTGSSDLYGRSGRLPHASINFVTAHDGFTLHDLVSYNAKHNEANGEDNRDGHDNNLSWNSGAEGPAEDRPDVLRLREQRKRNFLATLLLSQGVPMIVAGDEIGRSQGGNNNAYCQDNPISWVDWNLTPDKEALLAFAQRMIALRAMHPVFHRRHFFQGRPLHGTDVKDIVWLKPDGAEMTDEEWSHDFARCLGVYLEGGALDEVDARGRPVVDDGFLVLFNGHHEPVPFRLPEFGANHWRPLIDTVQADGLAAASTIQPGDVYPLQGRALVLLMRVKGTG